MNKLYMMGIITNRGMRDKFLAFFKQNNIQVTLSVLATGTANNAILDYFGIEAAEKVIYMAFITPDTWKEIKRALYHKMKIDVPGRGIAFLIPFSSIYGKKALHYLTDGQNISIEEESTLKDTQFELLITIANAGHTDTIMDAARSAQAPGGTVIHAKGTGMESAKKFFGVSLAEEKEMIFIVVCTSQKNDIMKAIMSQAGPQSKAGGIIFSLPVTDTAGLRLLSDVE